MTSKAHIAFGLFNGAVCTSYYQMSDISFTSNLFAISVAGFATLLGSLAPDLDASGSPISKLLPFISKSIQRRWPHRTLLHSIIGAAITSGIMYYVMFLLTFFLPDFESVPLILFLFFLSSYCGHLVVDSLTINGIKWIWPYQRAFAYPSSRQYRIRTGDRKPERYCTLLFLGLFLSYLPVLKAGGTSRSIHKTFKNFEMAKADYLEATKQTLLEFKGSYRHSRASVSGESLILDVKGGYFIVYLNEKVTTVGDQALILGTEFVCEFTSDSPEISELSIVNQPMDSILAQVPDDVLISGDLVSKREFQVTAPIYTANDYQTINLTSSGITFTYASRKEALYLNVRIPEDVRKLHIFLRTLEKDIASIGAEIEDMKKKRSSEKSLLVRHNLRKQTAELRSKKNALEKSFERKKTQLEEFGSPDIGFSGKIILRRIPSRGQNN